MTAAIFLLKMILCSGILFGYYWLALRNKSFHQWNRFYLLAITALSLLLPLIEIPIANSSGSKMVHYISAASIDDSIILVARQKAFISFSTEQWLTILYLLVSSFFLLLLIKAAKGILNVLKRYPKQKLEQFYFLNTDAKGAPFSFLNYMVWNREIDLQTETGKHIFRHELTHIQQKHTFDKIFMLLVLIPFWINPFFWIIRKELNVIHEFIADETALENGSANELSQMILQALYPKHADLLTSPFFQTSIKRRIKMFAIKNQKINYMSRILVLPILFIIVAAFTLKSNSTDNFAAKRINSQQPEQKKKEKFLNQNMQSGSVSPNEAEVIVEEIRKDDGNKNANEKQAGIVIESKKDLGKGVLTETLSDKVTSDKKQNALIVQLVNDTVPRKKDNSRVYTKVEIDPKFAGNWLEFLQKNLNAEVPINNGAPAGQYTVIAQFIVDDEGNISDLKTLTKHGYGMEAEVLRIMKLSPKWEPARQDGRKVTAYRKQPITFVISEE